MSDDFRDFIQTEDALFHYTKTCVVTNHILQSGEMKLSLLKDSNDPWEYKFRPFDMTGWSLPTDASQLFVDINTIIDRVLRNECRFMCFCSNSRPIIVLQNGEEVEDLYAIPEGWNRSRMWNQYGDKHSGACLVLSRSALEVCIKSHSELIDLYKFGFVRYSQEYRMSHDSHILNGNRLVTDGVEEYARSFIKNNFDNILFRKILDYRDEAEYRVVIHDPSSNIEYLDVSSAIRGVIWGDRITKEKLTELYRLCQQKNISCGHIFWERGRPFFLQKTKI
jgi:hypothetical protein